MLKYNNLKIGLTYLESVIGYLERLEKVLNKDYMVKIFLGRDVWWDLNKKVSIFNALSEEGFVSIIFKFDI